MFAIFVKEGGASLALGTTNGEMPLSVGGISLLVLIGSGIVLHRRQQGVNDEKATGRAATRLIWLMTVLSLFGASWLFPWGIAEKLPIVGMLTSMQFPWRMLAPATFGCALLTGFWCRWARNSGLCRQIFDDAKGTVRGEQIIVLTVTLFLIVANSLYYMDSLLDMKSISTKTMADTRGSSDGLYLYDGDSVSVWDNGQIVTSDESGLVVANYSHRGDGVSFSYQRIGENTESAETSIIVPLYYYPGYHVYVNGDEAIAKRTADGRIIFQVSEKAGNVAIRYEAPRSWYAAYVLSVTSAAAVVVWEVIRRLQIKHDRCVC